MITILIAESGITESWFEYILREKASILVKFTKLRKKECQKAPSLSIILVNVRNSRQLLNGPYKQITLVTYEKIKSVNCYIGSFKSYPEFLTFTIILAKANFLHNSGISTQQR